MNTRNPIPLDAAWPPRPSPASAVRSAMGRTASPPRLLAGRPLFLRLSEQQHLMFRACMSTAIAATFASVAAMGFVAGWKPLYPLMPATLLSMAALWGFEVRRFFADMAECERRRTRDADELITLLTDELVRSKMDLIAAKVSGAGQQEGTPASCGAVARGGGESMSLATDASNVVWPQFPNFWRH